MVVSKKRTFVLLGLALLAAGLFFWVAPITGRKPHPSHGHGDKRTEEFLLLVREQDPRAALDRLRAEIRQDPTRLRSCHPIVHAIGREAYRKYRDFARAVSFGDNLCNSGYLHGVIEAHFERVSDPLKTMKTVCQSYPPGGFMSWECYHGVGHGVMFYTGRDLKQSLSLCDSYEAKSASSTCANGVFMEYFTFEKDDPNPPFQTERDPFNECGRQAFRHQPDCYLYSPQYYLTMNEDDYSGALAWCNGAERPYHLACTHGVGNIAIKFNIEKPKFVEEICMSGTPEQVPRCIKGMVDLYINHFGSIEPAKQLCPRLKEPNHEACDQLVKSRSELFFKS
jgi:hypothetical protein